MHRLAFWLVTAPLLVGNTTARADQLSGRVEWKTRGGATPAQAVVYAEPTDRAAAPVPGKAAIQHKNKTFLPHVIAVPAGSTVTFPNDDPIFHNAFSLSSQEPFDMGLYRAGESKQRVFARPGVYNVFCNIHPQMAAFVVVTATPYVTVAAQDGTWRLVANTTKEDLKKIHDELNELGYLPPFEHSKHL